jgi:circadian clock protein KaiC
VRKAISLVKRRTGTHESTVRELRITPEGPRVGRALRELQGVLTGNLQYVGGTEPLMDAQGEAGVS